MKSKCVFTGWLVDTYAAHFGGQLHRAGASMFSSRDIGSLLSFLPVKEGKKGFSGRDEIK
jgi:hypothetical protein